ncbi:NAD(P)/FAD-dependent oxidoreductase [Rhodovulum visakhapatnamense]|uniref:Glycine/D-amino acid oxidase-like deaminating enzyme n=1 Tax=Rhodovulum visakhapatnamense TaxID=364297 RepID=A0A4R8G149_9RHOB|nr:FAD-dependent oxidoreductase [Rhodovulum visakhapatnamense]TDX33293.1 glycine/D-amino acid oxidase-like deaminating enzyme [Rhodovulum visakhapatnamense]
MTDKPQSLWAATARPGPDLSPLAESRRTDVLVIGGGFTGLSTALHLAEAGVAVTLLEAETPGHGGSGRNGGQVIPGLKDDPDGLDALFGPAATAFAGGTADILFDLVARHGIDCDASRDGWIQASLKDSHLPALERRMAQWQVRGAPVEWLDAQAIAEATGTRRFRGGWRDLRAGRVHPLNYVQGLAAAARRTGADLFAHSRVVEIRRTDAGWQARTQSGATVTADRVVLVTNAYTPPNLYRRIETTLVAANSIQIATPPLPPDLLKRILPGRSVLSESRRVGTYFRIGPGNRLMIGGRGRFSHGGTPADYGIIERELRAFFPEAARLGVEYRWSGRVGMTADHRVRLFEPDTGMIVAMGYNGRGVALGTAMGKALADHLARGTPLPLPSRKIDPLPFHRFHRSYGAAAIAWYRLRDALER